MGEDTLDPRALTEGAPFFALLFGVSLESVADCSPEEDALVLSSAGCTRSESGSRKGVEEGLGWNIENFGVERSVGEGGPVFRGTEESGTGEAKCVAACEAVCALRRGDVDIVFVDTTE
jgi:hypothetical protein